MGQCKFKRSGINSSCDAYTHLLKYARLQAGDSKTPDTDLSPIACYGAAPDTYSSTRRGERCTVVWNQGTIRFIGASLRLSEITHETLARSFARSVVPEKPMYALPSIPPSPLGPSLHDVLSSAYQCNAALAPYRTRHASADGLSCLRSVAKTRLGNHLEHVRGSWKPYKRSLHCSAHY